MWSITSDVWDWLKQARAERATPTADEQLKIEARNGDMENTNSHLLTIAGDTASIAVEGIITQKPDFWAMFFDGGNPTWPEIQSALASAEANPKVKNIEFVIDSPGGQIAGMFDAMTAVANATKPTTAIIGALGASAAFSFASQADKVVATGKSSTLGSVGVVIDTLIDPDAVSITSTEAPDKRPDLSTKKGKATVRAHLDTIHNLMATEIASGRGVSVSKVNSDFGRGGVMLAEQALAAGMIDEIAGTTLTAPSSGMPEEATTMDLTTLKAEHPAVFAEAVTIGVSQERDRVEAHLVLADASGDIDYATRAIAAGDELTAKVTAHHTAKALKARAVEDRADDDLDITPATSTAISKDDEKAETVEDKVLNAVFDAFGSDE